MAFCISVSYMCWSGKCLQKKSYININHFQSGSLLLKVIFPLVSICFLSKSSASKDFFLSSEFMPVICWRVSPREATQLLPELSFTFDLSRKYFCDLTFMFIFCLRGGNFSPCRSFSFIYSYLLFFVYVFWILYFN